MSKASTTGRLFVISAPSGAGKTSLVRALLARCPNLVVSVSYTTRRPRPDEIEGREYFFISTAQFQQLVRAGAFLEHAQVFDNLYGTGTAQVRDHLAAGRDVVLEIDWQGARQVRGAMPECVSIFILPPSRVALEQRLRARRSDSPEVIARRLRDAVADMEHHSEFDFVIVNDQFEQAVQDLASIVGGEDAHLQAGRSELAPLLQRLLRE